MPHPMNDVTLNLKRFKKGRKKHFFIKNLTNQQSIGMTIERDERSIRVSQYGLYLTKTAGRRRCSKLMWQGSALSTTPILRNLNTQNSTKHDVDECPLTCCVLGATKRQLHDKQTPSLLLSSFHFLHDDGVQNSRIISDEDLNRL